MRRRYKYELGVAKITLAHPERTHRQTSISKIEYYLDILSHETTFRRTFPSVLKVICTV